MFHNVKNKSNATKTLFSKMIEPQAKLSPQLRKITALRPRTFSNNTIPMADVIEHFDFVPNGQNSIATPPTTPSTAQIRLLREKKDKRFFDSADYFMTLQALHANATN